MSDLTFERITIANFKTFAGEHTFDLARAPGLYYITGANKVHPELGANGVGKSTIWDALTWVLWGRTGRDNRPADAVKPWAGKKGQTAVTLTFRGPGGGAIDITRTRNPNQLVVADLLGPRDVAQEEIPKVLGMSEELFRRTLVLGQFGTLFLDLKPEAQAQMFTEALDLDVWLRAIDVASKTATAAQRRADQAVADQQANSAALEQVALDIEEFTAQAATFEADKRARIKKGELGIAQLEIDLAAAEEACPKKPALPDDAELQAARTALADAQQAVRDDQYDLKDIEGALAKDQAELAELNKPKPTCKSCGQVLPSKQASKLVDQVQQSIRERQAPLRKARATLVESQQLLEAAQGAVGALQRAYTKERESYNGRLTKYEAAVRKVASIQGELKRWRDQLAAVQAETNTAAEQVARLKQRRTSLRTESTTIREAQEQALADAEDAKFWQDGFREIRLAIIDQTLVELEMATTRHAGMLGLTDWAVKFDTARETKAGTVSYAFSVLLYPPGKSEPVKWESYSGGESQRWQLATAFALSEVLLARAGLSPNIEVLDEPTKGLSGAGVSDLLEHLRDRALELGRAIYFVDHHSLDKGAFDGTLLVTKGKKGSTFAWQ